MSFVRRTYPSEHVVVITMSQEPFNPLSSSNSAQLSAAVEAYDQDPNLRACILTSSSRHFCAGADLKEWEERSSQGIKFDGKLASAGGISRRTGKKPIIAAVNGVCLGGGLEMVVNCDLVVACESAQFGFPEVKRGVWARAGALPHILRNLGLQRASELALVGDPITAHTAFEWGLVNRLAKDPSETLAIAIDLARKIAANSPDSIIATRTAFVYGLQHADPEQATLLHNDSVYALGTDAGANINIGLKAFKNKKLPQWINSKL